MKHLYHELDVLVNGKRVFSYRQARSIPTVQDMIAAVDAALNEPSTIQPARGQSPA